MNHLIDTQEAVEYLKQFAWVKDFDTVIEQIINGKVIDEENDDEIKNV
jgi:hypothetical protein